MPGSHGPGGAARESACKRFAKQNLGAGGLCLPAQVLSGAPTGLGQVGNAGGAERVSSALPCTERQRYDVASGLMPGSHGPGGAARESACKRFAKQNLGAGGLCLPAQVLSGAPTGLGQVGNAGGAERVSSALPRTERQRYDVASGLMRPSRGAAVPLRQNDFNFLICRPLEHKRAPRAKLAALSY